MSTHTQQTKKRRPHLFICILILLIALACIFVQRFAGTDIYNKASLPSIDFGNENEADGEWCLILVNKWHPLETDSEIDLTELSNGQCVDSRIYPQLQKMFDDKEHIMKNYSRAVTGTGVIANETAAALQKNGRNLFAIGNRTHGKAVAFAEKYSIGKVYDSYDEMFTDPDVDIIYITTPHNTHYGFIRSIL